MPNGNEHVTSGDYAMSGVRDLEIRVGKLEKAMSKVIEACGYEEQRLRMAILKEALEMMPP